MPRNKLWVIVCTRHEAAFTGAVLFHSPKFSGYTSDFDKAGRFTEEQARSEERMSRGQDFGIPESIAMRLPTRRIIAQEDLPLYFKNKARRTK